MASNTPKKTMLKKEKQPVAKKKPVTSPSKKVAAGPSGKTKKTAPAKKKEKKILPLKKTTATKKVVTTAVAKKTTAKKTTAKKTTAKKTAVKKPVAKKAGTGKKIVGKAEGSRDRLLDLKRSLISKKENILKEAKEEIAKYISGDNKQLVDTANDDGDWAQVDISEDLSLQRLSTHRKLLHNIDEALRKIAERTYGICEECGEEISEKRLMVLPTATLCVDCQENKEQFEALESEE
jgi:DnaK suppressor protein